MLELERSLPSCKYGEGNIGLEPGRAKSFRKQRALDDWVQSTPASRSVITGSLFDFKSKRKNRGVEVNYISPDRAVVSFGNGDQYSGKVKDGFPHGLGVMHHQNGQVFKGDYHMGFKEGQGVTHFPDGRKHIGTYRNGSISGYGTMHFVDGRKYIGDIEAGEFHGVGLTIYPNGDFFHGNFRNGEDPAHNSEKCLLCSQLMDDSNPLCTKVEASEAPKSLQQGK